MVLNTDYPSIGFLFANQWEPATENLWELMDGYSEGTGMNSRNHHMWSSYSHYIVQRLGGIAPAVGSAGGYADVLFDEIFIEWRECSTFVRKRSATALLSIPSYSWGFWVLLEHNILSWKY